MTEINAEYFSGSETIHGELTSGETVHGELANGKTIRGELVPGGIASVDYPPYTGNYVVTPSVEEQKLATKQKLLIEDLTIEKIPYSQVSNMSNGITVTIG